jgi:hypothetical protein
VFPQPSIMSTLQGKWAHGTPVATGSATTTSGGSAKGGGAGAGFVGAATGGLGSTDTGGDAGNGAHAEAARRLRPASGATRSIHAECTKPGGEVRHRTCDARQGTGTAMLPHVSTTRSDLAGLGAAVGAPSPTRRLVRAAIVLAVVGATLGPVLDYAHVVTGAIQYLPPVRFVPWWVPLLYANAAIAIGLSHPIVDRVLRPNAPVVVTPSRLLAGFVGFCAVWFASGAIHLSSAAVAGILAPVSIALWWGLDRTWQGASQALATAVGGVLVEITLSRAGLFAHTHPDVLGVAWWLPWIYVAASVGVGNVGRWLVR